MKNRSNASVRGEAFLAGSFFAGIVVSSKLGAGEYTPGFGMLSTFICFVFLAWREKKRREQLNGVLK